LFVSRFQGDLDGGRGDVSSLFRRGTVSRVDARQKFPGGSKALKKDGLRERMFGTRPAVRRLWLLGNDKLADSKNSKRVEGLSNRGRSEDVEENHETATRIRRTFCGLRGRGK
jgi:hypothetical protein